MKRHRNNFALKVALVLLAMVLTGGLTWFGIVSTGVLRPVPVVEIVARGGTNGTLRVVADADFWPYSFVDRNGELTGREIEMVNEIANRLGMKLEMRALSWSKCIDAAVAREADLVLSCDESSGGREREVLTMTAPIESDYYEVFGKEKVASIEDLRGRRIGQMVDGNVNAAMIAAGFGPDMVLYPSFDEVFKAMERGEVDFTITRNIQGRGCLREHPVPGVAPRLFAGKSYFCIGVDNRKPGLAKRIDDAISVMKLSGEMHRLSDKWLTTYVEPDDFGEVMRKQPKTIALILSLLLFLALVLLVLGFQRLRYSHDLERRAARSRVLFGIVRAAPWSVKFNAEREITRSVYSDDLRLVLQNDIPDNTGWVHLIHPEDRDRAVEESLAVLRDRSGNAEFDMEYRLLNRDGVYRWIRSAARIILNPDGSGELYGMCFDVDDHVRHRDERQHELEKANAELLAEKKRAEIVQDVMHSAVWRFKIDAEDRIVDWWYSRDICKIVKNDRAADTFEWKELVHPDDYEQTLEAFRATLKDRTCRTPYDVTFRMIDNDGNYNWFRSAGGIFRYPDGTGEFFGLHGDVSERIREQERLQREREAANAKDAILVQVVKARYGYNVTVDLETMKCSVIRGTGLEGAVTVFERCSTYQEVEEEFSAHVTDKEILGRIKELFAVDSIRRMASEGKRGYVGSVDYPTISSNPGEEGRVGWRQVHLFIGTDVNGRPVANFLGRNITAEHEQADAVARLRDAEQANRAKSEFLFSMSHDIRTPMHAIKGFADIAAKNLDNRETVRDCIDKIQTSGDLLFSLINSVLDMSRLQVGRMKLVEKPGDVYYSFQSVQSTMIESAKEKSIDLQFEFGEIADRYVFADFEKSSRIFVNIISNAIKYSKPNGYVKVRCEQVGEAVEKLKVEKLKGFGGDDSSTVQPFNYSTYRYTFSDNGIGMSEDFQNHVYERFAREENKAMGEIAGTGLGLSISKGFVELMGGTIECRSEQGVGTTFTVTLPFRLQEKGREKYIDPKTGREVAVNGEDRMEDSRSRCSAPDQNPDAFRGRRVLLVDDSMFNREVSKHYLVEAGFEVDTAESGQEAVEKVCCGGNEELRMKNEECRTDQFSSEEGDHHHSSSFIHHPSCPYDLILMDIRMPGMNGYEATRAIRDWESRMAIDRLTDLPIDRLGVGDATEQSSNSSIQSVNQTIGKSVNSHHIPIIALSANAFEEDRAASLAAGMDDHIAKGVSPAVLQECIVRNLEKSRV